MTTRRDESIVLCMPCNVHSTAITAPLQRFCALDLGFCHSFSSPRMCDNLAEPDLASFPEIPAARAYRERNLTSQEGSSRNGVCCCVMTATSDERHKTRAWRFRGLTPVFSARRLEKEERVVVTPIWTIVNNSYRRLCHAA